MLSGFRLPGTWATLDRSVTELVGFSRITVSIDNYEIRLSHVSNPLVYSKCPRDDKWYLKLDDPELTDLAHYACFLYSGEADGGVVSERAQERINPAIHVAPLSKTMTGVRYFDLPREVDPEAYKSPCKSFEYDALVNFSIGDIVHVGDDDVMVERCMLVTQTDFLDDLKTALAKCRTIEGVSRLQENVYNDISQPMDIDAYTARLDTVVQLNRGIDGRLKIKCTLQMARSMEMIDGIELF